MAVTFVTGGLSEFATSQTGNKTMTEPTGATTGDGMVFICCCDSGHSLGFPAGWTIPTGYGPATQGTMQYGAAYIVRGGSAPNLTWAFTGTGYLEILIILIRSSGGTVAFDAASAAGAASNTVNAPDPPAAVAVAASSLAVTGAINFGFSGTRDSAMATRSLAASGSEDPGAFGVTSGWAAPTNYTLRTTSGGGTTGASDGWNGFTLTFTDGAAAAAQVPYQPYYQGIVTQ